MIISHRLKFAYFRVPKTGSTSVEAVLRMCGAIDERDITTPMTVIGLKSSGLGEKWPEIDGPLVRGTRRDVIELGHSTPQEAIDNEFITLEQLREYRVFVALREPLDRIVSMNAHVMGIAVHPSQVMANIRSPIRNFGIVAKPTSDYFKVGTEIVAEPLDFEDFVPELRKMLAYIGGYTFPGVIPRFNKSRARDPNIPLMDFFDAETEAIVRAEYADDFALYAQMKAGTL